MTYFIYLVLVVTWIALFSQGSLFFAIGSSLGAIGLFIGIISGIYLSSHLLSKLIKDFNLDQKGVNRLICFGGLMAGLLLFVYPLIMSPDQLLVVRFFQGLTSGFSVPALISWLGNRNDNQANGRFGYFSQGAIGLALLIGSVNDSVSDQFLTIDYMMRSAVLVFICLGLFGVGYLFVRLGKIIAPTNDHLLGLRMIKDLLRRPLLNASYLGIFTLMYAMGVLFLLLPSKVADLGYGQTMTGVVVSVFSVASLLVLLLPIDRLYQRFKKQKILAVGLMLIAMCLLFMGISVMLPKLILGVVICGLQFGLLFLTALQLIAEGSTTEEQARASGLFYGFFSFGLVIGLSLSGLFLDPIAAFLVSALFICLSSIMLSLSTKP